MYSLFGGGNTPYSSGNSGNSNPFGGLLDRNSGGSSGNYQATGTNGINGNVAGGIFGFMASIASALLNNSLAQDRESFARQENFNYGELAAQNADERTRKLYQDLMSPYALLQQYKEAGLSPSLMFGGGGVGGQVQSGAQGTGAAGISPTTYGINFDAATLAQIKLADAQASKLNAETETIEGKNERGHLQLNELLAEIGVKNADEKLKTFNRELGEALKDNTIQTAKANLNKLYVTTEKLWFETTAQLIENQFNIETFDERVRRLDLQNSHLNTLIENTLADTQLKFAEKELIGNKINQIVSDIAISWFKAGLEERKVGAYESWVSNMDNYLQGQLHVAEERLKHDINIDWAKFGLNVGEFMETCVKDYIGSIFEHMGSLVNTDLIGTKIIK